MPAHAHDTPLIEYCKERGLPYARIYTMARDGRVPATQKDRRWYVDPDELDGRLEQIGNEEHKYESEKTGRDLREYWQAEKLRLQALTQSKELVPAVVIKKILFDAFRSLRSRMLALPDALTADLVLLSEPVAIQELLDKAIREALLETAQAIQNARFFRDARDTVTRDDS